jgi:hypothetical protein
MNNERKTQKEVTWSWRSFHFATLQNTKTKPQIPSSLRSSLTQNRDFKTFPPRPHELPNFSPQSEKTRKEFKEANVVSATQGLGFA